jgi:hypothetical protein
MFPRETFDFNPSFFHRESFLPARRHPRTANRRASSLSSRNNLTIYCTFTTRTNPPVYRRLLPSPLPSPTGGFLPRESRFLPHLQTPPLHRPTSSHRGDRRSGGCGGTRRCSRRWSCSASSQGRGLQPLLRAQLALDLEAPRPGHRVPPPLPTPRPRAPRRRDERKPYLPGRKSEGNIGSSEILCKASLNGSFIEFHGH